MYIQHDSTQSLIPLRSQYARITVEQVRPITVPGIERLFKALLSLKIAVINCGRGLRQKNAPITSPVLANISVKKSSCYSVIIPNYLYIIYILAAQVN
jgi:hypothetical protein